MTKAWVFGDDISTDLIIPGRYLVARTPEALGKYALEGADPNFSKKAGKGDIVIAGKNFGCGSSREQAPVALKGAGIKAVVAESYARIFYRNCVNQGISPLISKGAHRGFKSGDPVDIDLEKGTIRNLRTKKTYTAEPLPPLMLEITRAGGLIPYLKKHKR